jgi:hypothetical protein
MSVMVRDRSVLRSPQLIQRQHDSVGQSTTSLSLKARQRVIQLPLQLVATLWCSSEQLEHAHGLSHQQCLQFNTSLSLAAVVVVVMLPAVVAQADC